MAKKHQKTTREIYSKPRRATLMVGVMVLLTIFLMGNVTSANFDNVKSFDKNVGKYGKYEIKNWFGLTKLADIELKTNTPNCFMDCEAEKEITLYEDGSLVDDVRFYTIKNGERKLQDIREYHFYVQTGNTKIDVDDYEYSCINSGNYTQNGTEIKSCMNRVVGSHKEDAPEWTEFKLGDEFEKGTYTIKLIGEKRPERVVDWQIKSNGIWTTDWLIWGSAGSLQAYYKMDDATSPATDTMGNWPTTSIGDPTFNDNGILNTGIDFDGDDALNLSYDFMPFGEDDFTMNVWVNWSGSGWYNTIFGYYDSALTNLYLDNGEVKFYVSNSTFSAQPNLGHNLTEDVWQMITAMKNDTGAYLYVNGTLWDNTNLGGIINLTVLNDEHMIGSLDGTEFFTGDIDEFGFWNRTLTQAEITTLWNEGVGLPYGTEGVVTLNSPDDNEIVTSNEVLFNCTGTVGGTINNMSLWTNETGSWALRNNTNLAGGGELKEYENTGDDDFAGITTRSQTFTVGTLTADENFNIGKIGLKMERDGNPTGSVLVNIQAGSGTPSLSSGSIVASTISTANGGTWYNITMSSYELQASTQYFINVTHFDYVGGDEIWWRHLNTGTYAGGEAGAGGGQDNTFEVWELLTTVATSTQTWNRTLTDPTLWNCQLCDGDDVCVFGSNNRTLFIDAVAPTVAITYPETLVSYGKNGANLTLNWTATDDGTLDTCWYEYNVTNRTVTCNVNTTSFELDDQSDILFWANDSANNQASASVDWDYQIFENARFYNASTAETASETFTVNLTANSSLTSVYLIYNGTAYSASATGTNYSATIDIPTTVENKPLYYEMTYAGTNITGNQTLQTVALTNFSLCTAGQNDFLNVSFKDEADSSVINGSIPTSSFVYYLGGGTVNKTLTYIQTVNQTNHTFCAEPTARSLNVDARIQYSLGGYPQRVYDPPAIAYTSTVTQLPLYLLATADGTYIDFQVINIAEQTISGVVANASRVLDGTMTMVEAGVSNSAGLVTMWLNPDFSHEFYFNGTGYPIYYDAFAPTSSEYTISLGSSTTVSDDYLRGIVRTIGPSQGTLLNDTTYEFNFTLSSSYWGVTNFGFTLKNSSGTVLGSDSVSSNGGEAEVNLDVGSNTEIIMYYYWLANGNYTNFTRSWFVMNSGGTDFSVDNFFTNLKTTLSGDGIFGLSFSSDTSSSNFAINIVLFLLIFVVTGMMSYKFGLISPAAISALIFTFVLFLDVGVGLLPNPVDAVPHFILIFTGVIFAGALFREVYR